MIVLWQMDVRLMQSSFQLFETVNPTLKLEKHFIEQRLRVVEEKVWPLGYRYVFKLKIVLAWNDCFKRNRARNLMVLTKMNDQMKRWSRQTADMLDTCCSIVPVEIWLNHTVLFICPGTGSLLPIFNENIVGLPQGATWRVSIQYS